LCLYNNTYYKYIGMYNFKTPPDILEKTKALDLNGFDLNIELPPIPIEAFNLTHLEELNLCNNAIKILPK